MRLAHAVQEQIWLFGLVIQKRDNTSHNRNFRCGASYYRACCTLSPPYTWQTVADDVHAARVITENASTFNATMNYLLQL